MSGRLVLALGFSLLVFSRSLTAQQVVTTPASQALIDSILSDTTIVMPPDARSREPAISGTECSFSVLKNGSARVFSEFCQEVRIDSLGTRTILFLRGVDLASLPREVFIVGYASIYDGVDPRSVCEFWVRGDLLPNTSGERYTYKRFESCVLRDIFRFIPTIRAPR